jgi:hypothetical protein
LPNKSPTSGFSWDKPTVRPLGVAKDPADVTWSG